MGEEISLRNISLVESEFLTSKGGLKLKGLALDYFDNAQELETFQLLRYKVLRLVLREIVFLTLPKKKTILVLSAFGPFVRPRCVTILYFQNIALLESSNLKARLYRFYLTKFQSWSNCYVIIQNEWILKKYSIFNARKTIVHPLHEELSSTKKYILYPTSLNKYKNNENLIRTFLSVETNLLLVLTADVSGIDLENIGSNVKCIGSVDSFVMDQLYINAEAILLCSDYESYSYPLYEALAHKKPIIAKQAEYLNMESENLQKFHSWNDLKLILEDLSITLNVK
jgi:glycosyltransferase involved in cell wall biosynthesis